ncbi:CopG family transcriptional regulator [Candidatus Bathyarchaeota archaeon]|nr:MAG: CopG family transcriptional regulator [Candidatus Bathyarchaeota archaeon]
MSEIISIRIPKELKRKMDVLRKKVKWSEEIRRFLEQRVNELWREKVLEEIDRVIDGLNLPELPAGTVARIVREDRDSH